MQKISEDRERNRQESQICLNSNHTQEYRMLQSQGIKISLSPYKTKKEKIF